MYAYQEMYLDDARVNLAEAFDYAANTLHVSLKDFLDLMIVTGYAAWFEHGVAKVIVGMSGIELVQHACEKAGYLILKDSGEDSAGDFVEYEASTEYWIGYMLAYVQWYTNKSFAELIDIINFDELEMMYGALHESPEEKTLAVFEAREAEKKRMNRLSEYRKRMGYTQRKLAEQADVNIRTLQQYEIGSKRLNKSAADQLLDLAQTLGCDPNALI